MGGMGYVNETPTGRLLRDAKLYEIGAGTSEIRRMLIGRELLDRGEIRQITVICPPHLCEKWRADMIGQFNLAAEVVRPGAA